MKKPDKSQKSKSKRKNKKLASRPQENFGAPETNNFEDLSFAFTMRFWDALTNIEIGLEFF